MTDTTTERITMKITLPRCPRCNSTKLKSNGSPKKGSVKRRYSRCVTCGQPLLLIVQ